MKAAFILAFGLAGLTFAAKEQDYWPRIDVPTDHNAKLKVVCETSGASPKGSDIILGAKDSGKLDRCQQDNYWAGSQCTKLADRGTARVSICGSKGHTIDCHLVESLAKGIVDHCSDGDHAGGWGEWATWVESVDGHPVKGWWPVYDSRVAISKL